MGRSQSDEARKEWLRRKDQLAQSPNKQGAWNQMKRENERAHVHFMSTCLSCAQQFEICGLPCFVICPNCHLVLKCQFA